MPAPSPALRGGGKKWRSKTKKQPPGNLALNYASKMWPMTASFGNWSEPVLSTASTENRDYLALKCLEVTRKINAGPLPRAARGRKEVEVIAVGASYTSVRKAG